MDLKVAVPFAISKPERIQFRNSLDGSKTVVRNVISNETKILNLNVTDLTSSPMTIDKER